jgi:hypothetical protein
VSPRNSKRDPPPTHGDQDGRPDEREVCARRHLRFGWWCLLVFLGTGLVLEALHATKAGFYLDAANAIRREMWRLGHSHGALLAIINILYALTLRATGRTDRGTCRFASLCLGAGTILMPAGFFLGGVIIYEGDPGLLVLLVPLGGLLMLLGVASIARMISRGSVAGDPP